MLLPVSSLQPPDKELVMPKTIESVRQRIKAVELTDKLQGFVLNGTKMSQTQVAAALGLLKKVAPDMKAVDVTSGGQALISGTTIDYTKIDKLALSAPEVIDVVPREVEDLIE